MLPLTCKDWSKEKRNAYRLSLSITTQPQPKLSGCRYPLLCKDSQPHCKNTAGVSSAEHTHHCSVPARAAHRHRQEAALEAALAEVWEGSTQSTHGCPSCGLT